MTFTERLKAELPEIVYAVKVQDHKIKGVDSINVVVNYRVHGKTMFLDMNFAKKNHMTPEHIGAVVRSYLPKLD